MEIFDIDRWQEIAATLGKNKLRTFLTAFGVFWGLFMLIMMLGSGNGLQNGMNKDFSGFATNSIYIWTQRTSKPYAGLPPGRRFNLRNEDIKALREQVPEADVISARNQLGGYRGGNNVTRGTIAGAFSVMGDYPQITEVQKIDVFNGRFINRFDIEEKRKVAVVGTRVQEVLFKNDEEPVNDYIRINGVYFKVIGVFKSDKSGDRADRDLSTIYIPFTTFQQAFNYGDRVGWFAITSQPHIPATETEAKVLQVLASRHRIAPDDDRAFGHFNAEKEFTQMNGLFAGIKALIWIVGLGTLLAGVIGVSNIMLIVVKERTSEIGIRRALGATPWKIVSQIILESVVLTTIAGYTGLVAGVGILELIARNLPDGGTNMFLNPEVDLNVALQALTILIIAGALAGLIPARRAIALSTVDALRDEQ